MLIKEVIERIQNLYNEGVLPYYNRLSNRRIYSIIMSSRSLLLGQMLSKHLKISQNNYELLPCIELEIVSRDLCPCAVPSACTILRSKEKLPEILTSSTTYAIQSVLSTDWAIKFDYLNVNATRYATYDKYTSTKPSYFIHNDYLYILNITALQYVSMTAIFKDTVETFYKFNCGGDVCLKYSSYLERELSLDINLVPTVIQMVLQELSALNTPKNESKGEASPEQVQD